MSAIFPEMQQTFSKDVEDRANSYFQQIYNQPPSSNMPIDQVLEMLSRFKDSQDKMEKVKTLKPYCFFIYIDICLVSR